MKKIIIVLLVLFISIPILFNFLGLGLTFKAYANGEMNIYEFFQVISPVIHEKFLFFPPKVDYLEACVQPDAFWAIKYYIKHNKANPEGLLLAAEHNTNEIIVKELLTKLDIDLKTKNDAFWKSLENKNPKVCEVFIYDDVDINTVNSKGETPLLFTYTKNYRDIFNLLLKNRAFADEKNEKGETLLQMECAKEFPDLNVINSLIKAGANPDVKNNKGQTLLQFECSKTHPNASIVDTLLKGKADPEVKNVKGETPLMASCAKGDLASISIIDILIQGGANIETSNSKGETPLMIACSIGNLSIVNALIQGGANANSKTKTGKTLLQMEYSKNNLNIDIIKALLRGGADGQSLLLIECAKEAPNLGLINALINSSTNINTQNEKGETPLMIACENNNASVVSALLDGGANINVENNKGNNLLHEECIKEFPKIEIINALIKSGIDVNENNKDGETPLTLACAKGKSDVVRALLKGGADPELKNAKGESPETIAEINFHYEIATYLRKIHYEKVRIAAEEARVAAEEAEKKKFADSVEKMMVPIPGEAFEMLCTEVPQKIYERVMGNNPSKFYGVDRPVESVSWKDAIEFCNKLSAMCDLKPVYLGSFSSDSNITVDPNANGFRLPTVFEWQIAAEGGSNNLYSGGDVIDDVAWYYDNSGDYYSRGTHPVAQKDANGYGLYDMSGNVFEWCWNEDSERRHYRAYKGGGYNSSASDCEISSARKDSFKGLKTTVSFWIRPYTEKVDNLGFRVVREIK